MEFYFTLQTPIRLNKGILNGNLFHKSIKNFKFEKQEENLWNIKYKITCEINSDITEEAVMQKIMKEVHDRIFSLFTIISESDNIISESVVLNKKIYQVPSCITQAKEIRSVFELDIENSNLKNISDEEWDFIKIYSKTFPSIDNNQRISNLLISIDVGGKLYVKNNEVDDQVTKRMLFFLKKIGIEGDLADKICQARHSKIHENKNTELDFGITFNKLRSLIYKEAEKITGIRSTKTIDLHDFFISIK